MTEEELTTLPPDVLGEIDAIMGKIQESTPGFYSRPEQYRMIRALARTFLDQGTIVVEGPTGVGKSLSYILSGSIIAPRLKKKIVIATATVSLQEQLVSRDIPEFIAKSGMDIRVGIAKGRSRYACTARLARLGSTKSNDSILVDSRELNQDDSEMLAKMSIALKNGEWDGDRDNWDGDIPNHVWQTVTTERHGCTKRRCDFISSCPYYCARNRLRDTEIIVANQNVVLSDMEIGGGYLLPKPEDTIYVIDEGHHLPRKTIQHFTEGVRLHAIEKWTERLPKVASTLATLLKDHETGVLSKNCMVMAAELNRSVSGFVARLSNYGPIQVANGPGGDVDSPLYRFPNGVLPKIFAEYASEIRAKSAKLLDLMLALKDAGVEAASHGDVVAIKAEPWLAYLGTLCGRIQKSMNCWDLLLGNSDQDSQPIAKWVSVKEFHGKHDFHIEASRICPAALLAEKLWSRAASVVVTSATITTAGRFDHFAKESGLSLFSKTNYLRLGSPFDYENRAELHVPMMDTYPGRDDAHTKEITGMLPQLIDQGEATLVLFSSKHQMQEVLEHIPKELIERCLVQNQMCRKKLLTVHGQRIEKGEGSVIFGLQSFSEGLDLPGALCTHVIVTKIPFATPDDPVDQAIAEWLVKIGKNPFIEQSVPQACLRLVQAVGRLIRRETDWGRVTILDRRLIDKNYGKMLLKSLPPMRMKCTRLRPQYAA